MRRLIEEIEEGMEDDLINLSEKEFRAKYPEFMLELEDMNRKIEAGEEIELTCPEWAEKATYEELVEFFNRKIQ